MAEIHPPSPVKLFIAILWQEAGIRDLTRRLLEDRYGPADDESVSVPFDCTSYYQEEMGDSLKRNLISFRGLVAPDALSRIKQETNALEQELAGADGRRAINLDPGYLDFNKVVLASVKPGPQKIYLREGIWADLTLWYEKGHYRPFAWSFPDFKDGRYEAALLRMRGLYKEAMRGQL